MKASPVRGVLALLCLAAGARLLAWVAPAPAEVVSTLRHPEHATLERGVDAVALAAASAGCWAALCWLALALLVSVTATLPGECGRLADRVADVTVPAATRRLLAIALGLTVATAAGATPAMAGNQLSPRPAGSTLDLDWPISKAPALPATPPAARKASAPTRAADRVADHSTVVVGPGDSLWVIARRRLPAGAPHAQIAASWPRWHAANRPVIGADPDLLLPGQRLAPPTDTSGGQP